MVENSNLQIVCENEELKDFLTKFISDNSVRDDLDFNPNFIIKSLEINFSSSRRRGWDSLEDNWECFLTNCPLSSLLSIIGGRGFLYKMFKKYKVENLKGEYLLHYSTWDGKDSHGVNRCTLKDFYFSHMLSLNNPYINDQDKEKDPGLYEVHLSLMDLLDKSKDLKCGFYEVQYKSPRYGLRRKDKYTEGYVGTITECIGEEIKKKHDEILDSYDKLEREEEERENQKSKKRKK